MALNPSRSRPWLSRLHFLVRFLGLTGLLAVVVGLVMASVQGMLGGFERDWRQGLADAWQRIAAFASGQASGDALARTTLYVLLAGAGVALLWLLVEAVVVLRLAAARRSAFGFNAAVQVVLAAVLFVGINVFSYHRFCRIDCTRPDETGTRAFTLPANVQTQLQRLRGETTIVVLQQRRKADLADDQEQGYDTAAETVLIEKVRDLADQLRTFSDRTFRVVLLDARKKEFHNALADMTQDRPGLARAIKEAPENSLFFYAKDDKGKEHIQRLGFDAFMQLDKTASRQAGGGRGNLVLLNKGVGPLARRIMNLEERKPRVGVLVIDPLLSTRGTIELFTLAGLRKTLTEHGFEVRDVVLKNETTGQPAADTFEELRVEELRENLDALKEIVPDLEKEVEQFQKRANELKTAKLADFSRKYARELGGIRLTREAERQRLLEFFRERVALRSDELEQWRRKRQEWSAELARLDVDAALSQRRMVDVRGKLDRLLADCDLLIVPRYTRLPMGAMVADSVNDLYRLDEVQLSALRDFLKAGKPILACLGPVNEPAALPGAAPEGKDGLEEMLAQLGVYCSKQTVLFDTQVEDFTRQRQRRFQRATLGTVPGLDFTTPAKDPRPDVREALATAKPNPLRESLRLTERLLGSELDVRLRYLRPVYCDPDRGNAFPVRYRKSVGPVLAAAALGPLPLAAATLLEPDPPSVPAFAPEFLLTGAASWNDDHPFPTRERPIPRYAPPGLEDATRGTADEKRRGPFPVGVAVEAPVPAEWYPDKRGQRPTVRVAVIGHGGVFVDPVLSPARQKLLLDTCNWLLGRDDLLTEPAAEWKYPRLDLSARDRSLWLWGTRLGLPLLFAYLGLVVVLARRVR